MNTKKSSLSKITTLIANDFKKYWIFSFVELMEFFFASSSIILSSKDKLADLKLTVAGILQPNGFESGFVAMVFPVIAAYLVFGYLHNVASVTATHSMPISRKEHFVGHCISGYLLTTLPIIANGIVLGIIISIKNAGSIFAVTKLVLLMLLMSLVTNAFSVLAGMLVGTSAFHVLGAITLNLFVPAIMLIADSDLEILLKGYCTPEWGENAMGLFLPIMKIAEVKTLDIIWYIALSAILLIVSLIAYEKRALENATDGLVFKFTEPLIVGFLTFMFASSMGEYFIEFQNRNMFLIGMAIGIVLGYILITMTCEKTVRIFNARNLKNAAIFVCIMVLFVGGAKLDITGYSKKIPNEQDVQSVQITAFETTGYTSAAEGMLGWANDNTGATLDSSESIKLVREIHSQILGKDESDGQEEYFIIGLKYNQKNGTKLCRQYQISFKDAKKIPEIEELYESKEFKECYSFGDFAGAKSNKINHIEYCTYDDSEYKLVKDPGKLLAALDKDFAKRTFEQELKGEQFGDIEIYLKGKGDFINIITLYKSDTNTLAELKRQGLL